MSKMRKLEDIARLTSFFALCPHRPSSRLHPRVTKASH